MDENKAPYSWLWYRLIVWAAIIILFSALWIEKANLFNKQPTAPSNEQTVKFQPDTMRLKKI